MRHITEDGIRLIKGFESFSPAPYRCPAGIWTIGYGHTGPDVHEDTPAITVDQGEELLKVDLLRFERAVLRLITRRLTDGQFSALVSFTYNLGAGALQRSSLRMKCNRGEDAQVPAEFIKWVWAGGRKLPGLMRRRKMEAALYVASTRYEVN